MFSIKRFATFLPMLLVALMVASAAHAGATNPAVTLMEGIDLAGISQAVIALGVLVIAITMTFKGLSLGKKAVGAI